MYVAEDLINLKDRRSLSRGRADEIDEREPQEADPNSASDELGGSSTSTTSRWAPISQQPSRSTRTNRAKDALFRHLSRHAPRRAADGRDRRSLFKSLFFGQRAL